MKKLKFVTCILAVIFCAGMSAVSFIILGYNLHNQEFGLMDIFVQILLTVAGFSFMSISRVAFESASDTFDEIVYGEV